MTDGRNNLENIKTIHLKKYSNRSCHQNDISIRNHSFIIAFQGVSLVHEFDFRKNVTNLDLHNIDILKVKIPKRLFFIHYIWIFSNFGPKASK